MPLCQYAADPIFGTSRTSLSCKLFLLRPFMAMRSTVSTFNSDHPNSKRDPGRDDLAHMRIPSWDKILGQFLFYGQSLHDVGIQAI